MIEICNLNKSFQDKMVLKNVTATIPSGCVYGLIGPNGSGKTTLLRMIAGILKQDEGSILVDGEEVYENVEVKKEILLISDEPHYFNHATMKDMKEFYKTFYSFDEDTYQRYLNVFSLDEKRMIRNFTKGMKRQAMICIALAISPKYLLLDEAFDGLDPIMRLTFKQAIVKELSDKKMTVIISSHNLRELEDICDYFGIVEDYAISTSGMIEEQKSMIHKVQLAFTCEANEEMFKDFDILSLQIHSRVVNMVVKGNQDTISKQLDTLNPVMKEFLSVNLEEIFIYEMQRKGYGVYEQEVES